MTPRKAQEEPVVANPLLEVDPAACDRLRSLIKGSFQQHLPKLVLEQWVRELNPHGVERLLFANAEALVAQIRSEEGLPKHEEGEY